VKPKKQIPDDQTERGTLSAVHIGGGASGRRDLFLVAAIVLAAFCLRLIYILQFRHNPLFAYPMMDPSYNDQWARAFAEGRCFMEGEPYFRAPLYAWFLGFCYKIFGPGYLAPRIVQAVLGAISCGLVFLVARHFYSRTAAAAAGFVAATFWLFFYFEGELLIVPLIVFLDLLFLLLLVRGSISGSLFSLGAAGVVLGASALARPNILLFGICACLWLALFDRRSADSHPRPRFRAGWRRRLARAAVLGCACLITIAPVTIRNKLAGNDLVLISSQGGVNLFIGNNLASDGSAAVIPGARPGLWESYHDSIAIAEQAEGRALKPSEVSRHFFGRALAFVRDRPGDWFALTLKKVGYFWNQAEFTNNQPIRFFAERYGPVVGWMPIGFWLVGPLSLLGLILSMRRWRRFFPLYGFVLVYSASVIVFFVCTRFKIPVMPVLIILACGAVEWLITTFRLKRWHPLAVAILLLVPAFWWVNAQPKNWVDPAYIGLMNLGIFERDQDRLDRAIEYFEEGIEIKPEFVPLHNFLGHAHLAGNDLDAAQSAYREALDRARSIRWRFASDVAESMYGLSLIAVARENDTLALELLGETVRLDPYFTLAHVELGELLERLGRTADAIGAFEKALSLLGEGSREALRIAARIEALRLSEEGGKK